MKLSAFLKTKFFSLLFWPVVVAAISIPSFFLWQHFYPSIHQIPSSVHAVELPSGIKPQDLGHLSPDQQQQLDQAIAVSIEQQLAVNPILVENKTTVIVLTHNNQPILPDLNPPSVTPTTGSRDSSTPTPKPSPTFSPTSIPPTPTPTDTPQATPTTIPCTDTDGGKDYFTKGTLTTSYGDTYTDFCSDPNIVSEYYCPIGASFASDGYICPGLCLDGACLPIPSPTAIPTRANPTKKPLPTSTPTITPTPTNVPCTDTDGGKDIYTSGSVTTWGKTHFDTCYALQGVGDLDQCSGYYCRLLEFSCQPMGYQGEPFICQYGCLDDACIKTPSPTPTATLTLTPTSTPMPTSTLAPTATSTPIPTPTLSPDQYEITFVYAGDIEAKYNTATGKNLNNDIQQIYQETKKVFGPPRAPITVTVKYGSSDSGGRFSSYYNATTNEIILSDYDYHQLAIIQKVVLAFHDDITYFMPFNWELPLWNLTTGHVLAKLDSDYNGLTACPFCQLSGDSPAWATLYGDSWNPISAATFSSLVSDTLGKPLIEDPQFFIKFNQAIYQLPADWSLKTKLPAAAASVKTTVEGIPFNDWYSSQYVLHFNPVPGKYIVPFLNASSDPPEVTLAVKLVEVKSDGNKIDVGNKTITITGFDQLGTQFWSHQATADAQGVASLGPLPGHTCPVARFHIYVPDFTSRDFSYPYYNSNPIVPDVETQPGSNIYPGIFGVINRYSGQFKYVHGQTSYQSGGVDGNFIYWGAIDDGIFSITYMADDNDPGITKSISKFSGPYYVNFQLPAITSSSRSSATRGGSSETDFVCDTTNWHNYYSDNFEFEAQYPPGWDTQSAYTSDKIFQTRLSLVSTTDSASLLDHTAQHSFFDIIASTTDLKTDENYSRWFDNNTGTQTLSQTQISGRSAEQYLDETDMPGGSHRNIMYYFKEGNDYFLISLSYYITPDIKTANEQLADCFLNTIKLMEPEPTPEGGIYKCSQGMYLTFEERKQYPYDLPPGRCDNWDDKRTVCGYYRMVFDNNEMKDSHQEYPDACQFCADFDQSGRKGLRGTTFYNLGYTFGPCPN